VGAVGDEALMSAAQQAVALHLQRIYEPLMTEPLPRELAARLADLDRVGPSSDSGLGKNAAT
jgi:hypothetical protein